MSQINRRTLVSVLGLAPMGVGAEAFAAPAKSREGAADVFPDTGFAHGDGAWDADVWERRKEVFARALDRLAAEIRADRVVPSKMDVIARIEHGEYTRHEITFAFEYLPDREVS